MISNMVAPLSTSCENILHQTHGKMKTHQALNPARVNIQPDPESENETMIIATKKNTTQNSIESHVENLIVFRSNCLSANYGKQIRLREINYDRRLQIAQLI